MRAKKRTFLLLLVCCMMLGSMSVSAAGKSFDFTFTSKGQKKQTEAYKKADNEQNAYVTIQENAVENFIDDSDVFGCRVRKESNDAAMTDYTLLKKTARYRLPYTSKGYANTSYYLMGQIDSTSSYKTLTVQGIWVP